MALGLTVLTLWLASLGAFVFLHWLDGAAPRSVQLLANWGWLGALLAALPVILRTRRQANDR